MNYEFTTKYTKKHPDYWTYLSVLGDLVVCIISAKWTHVTEHGKLKRVSCGEQTQPNVNVLALR